MSSTCKVGVTQDAAKMIVKDYIKLNTFVLVS